MTWPTYPSLPPLILIYTQGGREGGRRGELILSLNKSEELGGGGGGGYDV